MDPIETGNDDSATPISPHTAATCAIATHDHFGQREAFENGTGIEPLPNSDELLCGGVLPGEGGWALCARAMYYDYELERYRHTDRPTLGCWLIPAEELVAR